MMWSRNGDGMGKGGGGGKEGEKGVVALHSFSTDGQMQLSFLHFPSVCAVCLFDLSPQDHSTLCSK